MKIKSLLLGSAAAMIAVSGAQAADAIIVEPEPMEYVKVCDMYGAGFFYIPGTETCININGYVRSTYTHAETDIRLRDSGGAAQATQTATVVSRGGASTTTRTTTAGDFNTSSWNYRGRLNFDVRNETEYGTLRSELRLQGGDSDASGDAVVGIDRALIHLAGFRLGYSDTYWTTNHGYGAGSPAINDGFYGYDQAIFFDYTATLMDGVSATIGVQDSNGGVAGAASPDIYGGFNATFGGLTVAGTAMRDDIGNGDDEWAYKVSAIMALGDSGWQVGGWYMKDDGNTQYIDGRFSSFIYNEHDEAWGIQANGAIAANLSVYGLYTETSGDSNRFSLNANGLGTDFESEAFAVGLVWAPVSGLTVQAEYFSSETEISSKTAADQSRANFDSDGVSIRVTRSF